MDEKLSAVDKIQNCFIALEVGRKIINAIANELGVDENDFEFYLEQSEMDNLGLGINGVDE